MDADKFLDCPPPTGDVFVCKRKIRRSIEDAHIPFTYVSANCLAGWFLSGLGQMGRFMPPEENVMIYGDGNQKVIWVREEDVAAYAIKTIDDDRTTNKTVYIRPQLNILSQNEVVQLWEKIQGRTLKKQFIQEQSWVERLKESMSTEEKYVMGFFHLIFFQGKTYNIDIGEDALEASSIYPDHQYETVEEYLSLLSESSL
ncbi:hypothetical protein KP509_04G012300 [Ceratopteris richardii]|nr:hypothetical protein KP509_04G012300 [Ceratopteris richardii]